MTVISAKCIQASVGPNGVPIHALAVVYPRFIHAENKTHRRLKIGSDIVTIETETALMDDPFLSRNAASSRAIPVKKMLDQVREDPAMPVHWGKNQGGMQAYTELSQEEAESAQAWWQTLGLQVAGSVEEAAEMYGLHKQVLNRVIEPWQWMTVVVTATDWKNFFALRDHPKAQPEIKELARVMREAIDSAEVMPLAAGELHVPFVDRKRVGFDMEYSVILDGEKVILSKDQALRVSASCCAQTSFRSLDYSLTKADNIYTILVEDEPVHASPFEHQAEALSNDSAVTFTLSQANAPIVRFPRGITHMDRNGALWSGNIRGWIQHRQLIANHEVRG